MRKGIYKYSTFFCVISLTGVIMLLLSFFWTRGQIISELMWSDQIDTGMDFFHSIEYTRGRVPYEKYGTLYTPLANLFFYVLYRMVPVSVSSNWANSFYESQLERGTPYDLRVWQAPMLLFIIFIILSVVCIYSMVSFCLDTKINTFLVSVSCILSYGMLYAYERGNIIIIAFLCSAFFVLNKDADSRFIRELALIALAISVGLKIYPVLLGILLLYDKNIKVIFRTVIYGIIFFFLPFLCFKEKFSAIPIFIRTVLDFSQNSVESCNGFSFDAIKNTVVYLIEYVTDLSINNYVCSIVGNLIKYVIVIGILLCGFLYKENWKRVMCVCSAMVLFSTQGIYVLIFMLLPLLVLFHDEDDNINLVSLIEALLLSLLIAPFPITGYIGSLPLQIVIILLIFYISYESIKKLINTRPQI